jgi:transcription elongation factor Elf1
MGVVSSTPEDMDQLEEMKLVVEKLIDSNEIVIFSKTTCPYCKSAKGVSVCLNMYGEKLSVICKYCCWM